MVLEKQLGLVQYSELKYCFPHYFHLEVLQKLGQQLEIVEVPVRIFSCLNDIQFNVKAISF